MVMDTEGFLYPVINKDVCINCGLCDKVCPYLSEKPATDNLPISIWAAKHKNPDVIDKSSSGGVFSLLADYIFERKGVVFGACFDDDWNVYHHYTESEHDLDRFRRSKYVQSRIGNSFQEVKKFLMSDRYVLFCGTPCQIKGLIKYLRKPYDKLVTIDFICHGVPSPLVWNRYLGEILGDKNIIQTINFRDKTDGWERFKFTIKSFSINQESVVLSQNHKKNYFMKGFLKDIYLRPSCYNCCAKSGSSGSDIQLADFWGAKEFDRSFYNESGVSLVVVASKKGADMFAKMNLETIKLKYEDLIISNMPYSCSASKPVQRDVFFERFEQEDLISLIDELTKPTIKEIIKLKIRLLLVRMRISHKLNMLLDKWKKNG